jgi:K+-sensing histidine kinase KdpD
MNIAIRNLLNSQQQEINKFLWTDWQVYTCILFHLVQNAIKHGTKNSLIQISIKY